MPYYVSASAVEVEKRLEESCRKYKPTAEKLECGKAATDMADYLKRNKLEFKFAEIQFNGTVNIFSDIWSPKNSSQSISYNGYHVGVLYNGKVFCNVHPYGLLEQLWFNDFISTNPTKYMLVSSLPRGPGYLNYRDLTPNIINRR